MLANIYLHEVLDVWFEREVRPRLEGHAAVIRFADDFVIVIDKQSDVQKLMEVLPKRFAKYGLQLHPDKTRVVAFARPRLKKRDDDDDDARPGTFDFLAFTHYWGKSRAGRWVVKRKTSRRRFTRSLKRIWEWCKANRHDEVAEQRKQLNMKLTGHYQYFGITGNFDALARFAFEVRRAWRYWLDRRSQRARMSWGRFKELIRRHPLKPPRIAHVYAAPLAKP